MGFRSSLLGFARVHTALLFQRFCKGLIRSFQIQDPLTKHAADTQRSQIQESSLLQTPEQALSSNPMGRVRGSGFRGFRVSGLQRLKG